KRTRSSRTRPERKLGGRHCRAALPRVTPCPRRSAGGPTAGSCLPRGRPGRPCDTERNRLGRYFSRVAPLLARHGACSCGLRLALESLNQGEADEQTSSLVVGAALSGLQRVDEVA